MKIKEIISEWTDAARAKRYNPNSATYAGNKMPTLDDPVMDKSVGFPEVDRYELEYDPDLEKSSMDDALKRKVERLMAGLTAQERAVLTLRFGLNGHEEHTLADIGKRLGVQQERIRQVEAKALRKLRHPSRSDSLVGHLD